MLFMTDTFTKSQRSEIMRHVAGKDTKPERVVRSLLHRQGFRFRLHRKDLPGKPDIVLPKWGAVVFVHGCFWHRHPHCKRATMPADNADYWRAKFARNKARDKANVKKLEKLGWRVIIVWECELKRLDELGERLRLEISGAS